MLNRKKRYGRRGKGPVFLVVVKWILILVMHITAER